MGENMIAGTASCLLICLTQMGARLVYESVLPMLARRHVEWALDRAVRHVEKVQPGLIGAAKSDAIQKWFHDLTKVSCSVRTPYTRQIPHYPRRRSMRRHAHHHPLS